MTQAPGPYQGPYPIGPEVRQGITGGVYWYGVDGLGEYGFPATPQVSTSHSLKPACIGLGAIGTVLGVSLLLNILVPVLIALGALTFLALGIFAEVARHEQQQIRSNYLLNQAVRRRESGGRPLD